MKNLLPIVFSLIYIQSFSQSWTLKVDKSQKYSHDYRFSAMPANEHALEYKAGDSASKITVSNLEGDTTYLVSEITISRIGLDSSIIFKGSILGTKNIKLDAGKYCIRIHSTNFGYFNTDVEIKQNEFFDLKIKLVEQLIFMGWYHLRSKKELSEEEIIKVINCVRERSTNPSKICDKKSKYYLTMEI